MHLTNYKMFNKTFGKYYPSSKSTNSCHFCELLSIQFLPPRFFFFYFFEDKRANCLTTDNREGDNDDVAGQDWHFYSTTMTVTLTFSRSSIRIDTSIQLAV